MTDIAMKDLQRFSGKYVVDSNGCWVWQGKLNNQGYGEFYYQNKTMRAHRFSYLTYVGPLVRTRVIDHLCRNRACVNPEHLEQVTNYVNITVRGEGLAGINSRKTHCIKGHPFDEINTWRRPDRRGNGRVWKVCKQCNRDAMREWQRKRRAKLKRVHKH